MSSQDFQMSGVMEPEREPGSTDSEQKRPARLWALALLFCTIQFTIVSVLLLVVLYQVSAGYATPPRPYLSVTHPQLWEVTFQSWVALSQPIHWLDQLDKLAGMGLYKWDEPVRIVVQCGFCGLVWGMATFIVYWLVMRIGAWIRRLIRKPELTAAVTAREPSAPALTPASPARQTPVGYTRWTSYAAPAPQTERRA